jgi:hydrogenase maturation protease
MARVLVIGYGNPLRGDDALGPRAVERLRPLLPRPVLSDAELLSCHQLSPELAERLAVCERAIFVDAAACGKPGTVRIQRLRPEAGGTDSLTHHTPPARLLALAQELYRCKPQAMLVTGVGERFRIGEGLSEAGAEALEEICRLLPRLLFRRRSGSGNLASTTLPVRNLADSKYFENF